MQHGAMPRADLPEPGEAVKKYRLRQAEWVSEVSNLRDGWNARIELWLCWIEHGGSRSAAHVGSDSC